MAAPDAILRSNSELVKSPQRPRSYRFSGIEGDANHSFGYHLAVVRLPNGDYSFRLTRDVNGGRAHPNLASAWDLSFSPSDMKLVTGRLYTAAIRNDPRMRPVREFCGTRNGYQTFAFDLSNRSISIDGWDPSHIWHDHISFYRDSCNDFKAIMGVVEVICGIPLAKSKYYKEIPYVPPKFPLRRNQVFSTTRHRTGEHVAMIQRQLQRVGCAPARQSWADGVYGRETAVAVVKYKKLHRKQFIKPNGAVGPITWKFLFDPKFK